MDLSTGKKHSWLEMDYPQLSRYLWDRAYLSSFGESKRDAEDLAGDIPYLN
jgi:hypothetical protein